MEDLTGKQLGPYQVVAPLGEGGMAAVYKAFQPGMDRYVALKILPRHFASDPQFVARFEQEAKILAKLQYPHILPVHDFGEADGYTYIVMPFVQSGTLADLLTGQPLPLVQISRMISQIGDALDYAHSRGLVHRDVKPSNVLLDERGNCLLTDFGIAKILEGDNRLTVTGGIMGTPAYMSPEQGVGKKIDARSDIYALGVIMYELATGRVPYLAETPMAVMVKHINDPLPPPRSVNPTLPEAVEQVILKALAKQPVDRYATAGGMVRAVNSIPMLPDVPVDDKTVLSSVENNVGSSTQIEDQAGATAIPRKQSSFKYVWLGGGLVVGALAILSIFLFNLFNIFPPPSPNNSVALEPTPTLTPMPSPTQALSEPANTAISEPTFTATPQPNNSVASEQTPTLIPTPSPTHTPEPTNTSTPEPTFTASADYCADIPTSTTHEVMLRFVNYTDSSYSYRWIDLDGNLDSRITTIPPDSWDQENTTPTHEFAIFDSNNQRVGTVVAGNEPTQCVQLSSLQPTSIPSPTSDNTVDIPEVAIPPDAPIVDTSGYYHLQTMSWEAENRCLEGNRVAEGAFINGAAFMDECQNVTGQLWKLNPVENGYYRLQTMFLEAENKCLEGNRVADDAFLSGGSFMDDCQNVTGQLWKFVETEVDGYYRLQTKFLEAENKCLEGNGVASPYINGAAFMDNCQNVTGQFWKLIPVP